jgi:DNA-binding FadR family transcriptional regulator
MMLHDELHGGAGKAATAIQFHDRLAQVLTHVCSNLSYLAEFVASSDAPKSAEQWAQLRDRVRGTHSMEEERALYDQLNRAGSPEEKQQAMDQHRSASGGGGAGKVELF